MKEKPNKGKLTAADGVVEVLLKRQVQSQDRQVASPRFH